MIREFFPLDAPVIMVGSKYTSAENSAELVSAALGKYGLLAGGQGEAGSGQGWESVIKIMTLEELLPMSFGPEHLAR